MECAHAVLGCVVLYKRFLWAAEKKAPGIVALKIPGNKTQLKHLVHLFKNFTKNCTKSAAENTVHVYCTTCTTCTLYIGSHEFTRFCKYVWTSNMKRCGTVGGMEYLVHFVGTYMFSAFCKLSYQRVFTLLNLYLRYINRVLSSRWVHCYVMYEYCIRMCAVYRNRR
jgi:hypothetical protein